MIKYKIMTNGTKYRIKIKKFLFWRYTCHRALPNLAYAPTEFLSLEAAEAYLEKRILEDESKNKKWRVVK